MDLTAKNLTVTVPTGSDYAGFVAGEGITPTYLESLSQPGTKPNTFTYDAKNGTNLNNYDYN